MASAFLAALPLLVAGRYHPASYGFLFGKSSGRAGRSPAKKILAVYPPSHGTSMHNPRLKSDPAPRALVVLHSLLLDLLCLLLHPLLQQMLLASFLGLPSVGCCGPRRTPAT